MDIALIMFGSLISTMTALTFLEVRRIRKSTESRMAELKRSATPLREPQSPDSGVGR